MVIQVAELESLINTNQPKVNIELPNQSKGRESACKEIFTSTLQPDQPERFSTTHSLSHSTNLSEKIKKLELDGHLSPFLVYSFLEHLERSDDYERKGA